VIKSRRMRWAVRVTSVGETRGAYKVLVGKPEEMRPIGRPRLKWEGNMKMELQEVGWGECTALLCLRIGTGRGLL
jgi:hypothetical protein